MRKINPHLDSLLDLAFTEDVSAGDVTAEACVPAGTQASAWVLAKQDFVIAGIEPFTGVFERFGDAITSFNVHKGDGELAKKGDKFIELTGDAHALLIGERPALNFLMRLSGIATKTRDIVESVKDLPTRIVDTRKTTPGWRSLEKAAVKAGGGHNHRFALYDGIMVKENHIACSGGIANAVKRARENNHHLLKIEVETTNLDEVQQAVDAGADVIMLDNMDNTMTKSAVDIIRKGDRHIVIEASGNMTKDRLPAVCKLGVDVISMGALTHSAVAVDISMKMKLVLPSS